MKPHSAPNFRSTLQVLIFQDGLSARSFTVPLTWITRLGWTLGACVIVTFLALASSFHFWRISKSAQPERLRELEQQIRTLGEAQTQEVPAPAPSVATCAVPAAVEAPPTSSGASKLSPVAPTQEHFRLYSAQFNGELPIIARPALPIEIRAPLVQWQGKRLKVQFDIGYIGKEWGNQQGRIVVIARGPGALISYPSGTLRSADSSFLIDPEQGEFFSVSRFRQTKVEFPAIDTPIRSAEILLFGIDSLDGKQKLLMRESLAVPNTAGAPRDNTEKR
ncbi:MAG: hypothetical protein RJB38_493 [Pseudomonadota bacterium]|jgi:hypothetical protein